MEMDDSVKNFITFFKVLWNSNPKFKNNFRSCSSIRRGTEGALGESYNRLFPELYFTTYLASLRKIRTHKYYTLGVFKKFPCSILV